MSDTLFPLFFNNHANKSVHDCDSIARSPPWIPACSFCSRIPCRSDSAYKVGFSERLHIDPDRNSGGYSALTGDPSPQTELPPDVRILHQGVFCFLSGFTGLVQAAGAIFLLAFADGCRINYRCVKILPLRKVSAVSSIIHISLILRDINNQSIFRSIIRGRQKSTLLSRCTFHNAAVPGFDFIVT